MNQYKTLPNLSIALDFYYRSENVKLRNKYSPCITIDRGTEELLNLGGSGRGHCSLDRRSMGS